MRGVPNRSLRTLCPYFLPSSHFSPNSMLPLLSDSPYSRPFSWLYSTLITSEEVSHETHTPQEVPRQRRLRRRRPTLSFSPPSQPFLQSSIPLSTQLFPPSRISTSPLSRRTRLHSFPFPRKRLSRHHLLKRVHSKCSDSGNDENSLVDGSKGSSS